MGGTDGFTELAGDAAFFAGGVAAEGMFAAEAGGDGAFFEGVIDRIPNIQDSACLGGWV